jgi:transposase-like protein
MKKQRKHYSPEEKVAILRRHLLENGPSRSCAMKWDSSRRSSTVGRRNFSRKGAAAFEQKPNHSAEEARIAYLEKKMQTKVEVLAELMAEHVTLQKDIGELSPEPGPARYAGSDHGFRPALVGED